MYICIYMIVYIINAESSFPHHFFSGRDHCDVLLRPWPNSSAASARPSSRSGRQCHAPRSPWPRGSAAEAPGQLTDGGEMGGCLRGKTRGKL